MSDSQQDYISILKRIKEKEDQVQVEIEKHRVSIEQDIKNLQDELENLISETKIEGKKNG
jgi:stress response protein YsnF